MQKSPSKKEASIEETPQINSEFDLTNLIQISGNDMAFVRETIELVLLTTPETIEEIQSSYQEKDLKQLKRTIHCIKPIMIMFNHVEIRALIAEIELCEDYSDIDQIIPKLVSLLSEFITSLKVKN